jgi:uncharacterized protein
LLALAREIITSGLPVIVDAAFLKATHRAWFSHLADEFGIPFFIFDIQANPTTMRKRVAARLDTGLDASDAGIAILQHQLATAEPLQDDERTQSITVDMESGMERLSAATLCAPVLEAIDIR